RSHADIAAGAPLVLDEYACAHRLLHGGGHDAGDDVGWSSRRVRYHDLDRTVGVGCLRRPRLPKRAEAKQSGCGNEAPARHRSLSHYAGHSILIVRTPRKNSTMHALQSFQWHKARYLAVPRSWNASRQHLGFFWIGDPIAVGVGLQLFCDARRN